MMRSARGRNAGLRGPVVGEEKASQGALLLSIPDVGFFSRGSAPRARQGRGRELGETHLRQRRGAALDGGIAGSGALGRVLLGHGVRASGWRRATVLLGSDAALAPSGSPGTPPRARARRTSPRARAGEAETSETRARLARLAVEPGDPRDARGRDLRPGTWRGRPEGRRQPSENTSGRARPSRSPVLAPDARTPRIRDARIEDHANALGVRREPRPGTDERAPRVVVHNGPVRERHKTDNSQLRSVTRLTYRTPFKRDRVSDSYGVQSGPPKDAESA